MARTRGTYTGGGGAVIPQNPTPSQREGDIKVGGGEQYAFGPSFLVRGEIERFRVNDAVVNHPNVNLYSVRFVVPFGRSPGPAPRVAQAEPAYVAPAPAVAVVAPLPPDTPVAAFAPPTPVTRQRVRIAAESLFSFDRAELHPAGKTALDSFAQQLAGTTFDNSTVDGHTDRLGTVAYNRKLSLERAEAVKSYLVDTDKVDAAKVTAVGMSESAPVTKPGDCKGATATPKLIARLQPDRRVEIEVAATR